jgi:hypothetical protein
MNEQIEAVITQAIVGAYDLIDNIFKFDDNIDFAFKEALIPLVVKGVNDIKDGEITNATVNSVLSTAYDAVDGQFNFDSNLDFGFKMMLLPVVTPLITGGINSLLKNATA